MENILDILKKTLLCGIVWALTNYFIKRGLDPETKEYHKIFISESIYGGIAVSLNVIILTILNLVL